jgi:peroxiredoxin
MALTESTMLALGTPAPDFTLPDVATGKKMSLADFKGKKALLIMFICRHCPYVQHVKGGLSSLAKDYQNKNVAIVAINSNDAQTYPDDAPDSLAAFAREEGFTFPMLYDESQKTALAYTAACTPDFFLFDGAGRLVYRGQMDESRPGNGKPVTGKDLRAALDNALAGQPVSALQRPSAGCNIKWKTGNAPDYFAPKKK